MRRPRARCHQHGRWRVLARVERFAEPALLLLLREHPAHGYDLLERLPELTGEARIEMGNLYRLLRGLEEEELVSSEWDDSSPGPAKRRYAITPAGARRLPPRAPGAPPPDPPRGRTGPSTMGPSPAAPPRAPLPLSRTVRGEEVNM